jgi:putative endonuclease
MLRRLLRSAVKRAEEPDGTLKLGRKAESLACGYLEQQGLTLVETNYRCRRGEIDLIMQDKDSLVFVEVRFRTHKNYGSGAESVDWRKQRKLGACAAHYLQHYPRRSRQPCRFDVVSIALESDRHIYEWIKDAFYAS